MNKNIDYLKSHYENYNYPEPVQDIDKELIESLTQKEIKDEISSLQLPKNDKKALINFLVSDLNMKRIVTAPVQELQRIEAATKKKLEDKKKQAELERLQSIERERERMGQQKRAPAPLPAQAQALRASGASSGELQKQKDYYQEHHKVYHQEHQKQT